MKAEKLFTRTNNFQLLLLYSGYDEYHELEEIARILKIPMNTVKNKISSWTKTHPEIMNKIAEDRECIKHTVNRLDKRLDHPVAYKDETMAQFIKEKF